MTLTIELSREEEERLKRAAQQEGMDIEQYAKQRLGLTESPQSGPDAKNRALIELLESWRREDATDDEEELERRDAEWEELKANLNANRAATGERLLFP
jgi:DNA mismatch repair ATPase MutL